MTVTVCVFTYNRPDMLMSVLKHLQNKVTNIAVFDDASKFNPKDYLDLCDVYNRSPKNNGKLNFHRQWAKALTYCKNTPSDLYIFMPDDFEKIQIDNIVTLHSKFTSPYAFNIINDGRDACWTAIQRKKVNVGNIAVSRVGFVDCGFFCPRATLDRLMYFVNPTPAGWYKNEERSSGVGCQLSNRLLRANVPMYQPIKSLAYHGDHESKMHPNHRKKVPLKSI